MRDDMARTTAAVAVGVGLGAGLMYYLDPDRGSRRRTHARNQIRHTSYQLRDAARRQVQSLWRSFEGEDDRVVGERVRAALGRAVSHAHALAIDVRNGVVTISGPILRDEIRATLKALTRVPGVRRVVNAMDAHPSPRRVPSVTREGRLAWAGDRGTGARRVAATLAVAGLGLAARAAMHPRTHETELRS
jgi:hypothetical protein